MTDQRPLFPRPQPDFDTMIGLKAPRIPLRDCHGAVVGWTVCDREDFEEFNARRWHRSSHGYARTCIPKKRHTFMHNLVMGAKGIDHINGDRLDNRRANLRLATPSQNMQNMVGLHKTSMYRGVSWHVIGRKWEASARADGRKLYLGLFKDELEAARVARAARLKFMPFANEDRVVIPERDELEDAA